MLDAKENLEDYSSCDITATTSVDKNHDTFDESAILAGKFFLKKYLVFKIYFCKLNFSRQGKWGQSFYAFYKNGQRKRRMV